MEVEGKVNNKRISILIDLGATLSYVTHGVVDSNKLKKVKHTKSWLVQLATGTKRKVTDFISNCELSLDGQNTNLNLNILLLRSYNIIIGINWLRSINQFWIFMKNQLFTEMKTTLLGQYNAS